MTSSFGIDTGYSSIANNYLALSVSDDDYIFGSNFTFDSKPIKYNEIVNFQKEFIEGQEYDYNTQLEYKKNKNIGVNNINNTLSIRDKIESSTKYINSYELLTMLPECSLFLKYLIKYNLVNILQGESPFYSSTVFAVRNEIFQKFLDNMSNYDSASLRGILRSHILGYKLYYNTIVGRILRLETKNPFFSPIVDGSGKINNRISIVQPCVNLSYDFLPSKPLKRVYIDDMIECDNGMIILIDNMFDANFQI